MSRRSHYVYHLKILPVLLALAAWGYYNRESDWGRVLAFLTVIPILASSYRLTKSLWKHNENIILDRVNNLVSRNGQPHTTMADISHLEVTERIGGKYSARIIGYKLDLHFKSSKPIRVEDLSYDVTDVNPHPDQQFACFAAAIATFAGVLVTWPEPWPP